MMIDTLPIQQTDVTPPARLAVIVAVYNVEPYLANSLSSIQCQQYHNWMCFVVDDGSTDNSVEIARQFASDDHRFRVINTPNRGQGMARNLALDMIAEETEQPFDYVGFVDGDDHIEPSMFDAMIKAAESVHGPVVCGFYFFDNQRRWGERKLLHDEVISQDDFVSLVYSEGKWKDAYVSGGMVWKEVIPADAIRNIRFPDDRESVEDELFLVKVAANFSQFYVIPEQYYGYRQRPGSSIRQGNFHRRLFKGRLKGLAVSGLSDKAYGTILAACIQSAFACLKAGNTEPLETLKPYLADYRSLYAQGLLPEYAYKIVKKIQEHPILTRMQCVLSRFNARLHGRG